MSSWSKIIAVLWLRYPNFSVLEFESMVQLVEASDSPESILELPLSPTFKKHLRQRSPWWKYAHEDLQEIERLGIKTIVWSDPHYPHQLRDLETPPIMLTCLGDLPSPESFKFISIVGSRNPHVNSLDWLRQEVSPLLKEDICIVSGGARGIDSAAHHLACSFKKPTIVILPAGLEAPYPASWKERISDVLRYGGCFLSEFYPHQEMKKHYFYQRNRLIAAFSPVVFIVECRRRSGTWMTSQHAISLHRTVVTLPASPLEECFRGNLDLLYDGAIPLRDGYDLLGALSICSK